MALFICMTLFLGCVMARAQLADTIWTGNAKITIPALTATDQDGELLNYPKTITGLTFIVPVEVWFWNNSKFLIVYRQREMGADVARGELQPLIGEWEIPAEARVRSLRKTMPKWVLSQNQISKGRLKRAPSKDGKSADPSGLRETMLIELIHCVPSQIVSANWA